MKHFLTTLIFIAASTTLSFGQLHFGAGLSFVTLDNLGVQGKVIVDLEGKTDQPIEGVGSFTYVFIDDATAWAIDLDAHYRLLTIGDDIELDPIAGFQIARVSAFGFGNSDLGFNLGGHLTIPLSSFTAYVQPKLTFGGFDGFTLSAGIIF